jgi:hypothetical protein
MIPKTMTIDQPFKIFYNRDTDFDFCRFFLVVSMIFTHVFEHFNVFPHNFRITFYVTIGFVLISGFVIGGKNSHRVGQAPYKYLHKYFSRFGKIFMIYFFLNLPVILLEPSRLDRLHQTSIIEFLWLTLSGELGGVFAFDILPAIALTTFFAWAIMSSTKKIRIGFIASLLSIIPFSLLFILELYAGDKYITIKLLLIGIFGCLLGKSASLINWKNFLKLISNKKLLISSCFILILYFSAIFYNFWPNGPILLWRHLLPTTLLIFFVYVFSYYLSIGKIKWIRFLSFIFSEYMLFSYIFHIGLIKLGRVFIDDNFYLVDTIFIGILFNAITITACFLIDIGRKRVKIISRLYSFIFKV